MQNRVGRFIKGGISQSYGRADAAWSAGRNITAQLYWESMEQMVSPKQLGELARATNLLSGVFSFGGVGMPKNHQNILTAFAFFAPRFTYSQIALVSHIFRGGVTAREAQKSVLGIMMLNNMVFGLAAIALGQEPKLNPLPKSLGGDGSDVWTIRIGTRRYGIGGLLYSPMRLIAELASTIDDPDWLLSVDGFISTQNPLIRWWRNKLPGPTSLAWSFLDGKDPYTNENLRGYGEDAKVLPWAPHWRILRNALPIWTDTLKVGEMAWGPSVAEFFGLRSRPESLWTQWVRAVEEADPQHRSYAEIGRIEARNITSADPELKELYEESRKEAANRGWTNDKTDYYEEISEANYNFNEELRDIEQNHIGGDNMFQNMKQLRKSFVAAKLSYRKELLRIESNYPEIVADLDSEEPTSLVDKAYRDQMNIIHNPDNWESITGRVRKTLGDQMDIWEEETPKAVQDEIEYYGKITMQERPLLYQIFMVSQMVTREYWDVYDQFAEKYPEFAAQEAAIERVETGWGAGPMSLEERLLKDTLINGFPYQAYIDTRNEVLLNVITVEREGMPSGFIDAVLAMWQYRNSSAPKTEAGRKSLETLYETWNEDVKKLTKFYHDQKKNN